MKISLLALAFITLRFAACSSSNEAGGPPSYTAEAPLPKGWPAPGPYDQVSVKTYPPYRTAETAGRSETLSFFRLFDHIKDRQIPMTAPVEMTMESSPNSLKKENMRFLYQNTKVGERGDFDRVRVADQPPVTAYSYAFMGRDNEANIARAREAIDVKLARQGKTAQAYRLLGYNGPDVPKDRQTWELQAIVD